MKTLITVGTDGSLTQIRPSKGKGLDLRKFAPIEMRRSSLIEFDEKEQAFYVKFIDQSKDCCFWPDGVLRIQDAIKTGITDLQGSIVRVKGENASATIWFAEYEDGVSAEVKFLEHWRKAGLLVG